MKNWIAKNSIKPILNEYFSNKRMNIFRATKFYCNSQNVQCIEYPLNLPPSKFPQLRGLRSYGKQNKVK